MSLALIRTPVWCYAVKRSGWALTSHISGLNYFFGQLQALAFEEEFKPEKMYDKTKPLLDGMHAVRL
jgi:hypothetical protein